MAASIGISPLEQLDRHLTEDALKPRKESDVPFDMDDTQTLTVLTPFPRLQFALETIDKILVPAFSTADQAALDHQKNHKLNAKFAAATGAVAIVAACVQLGFTARDATPPWVVVAEFMAVGFCITTIVIGLRAARQKHWLICRNVAERLRHLKFHALTRKDLWCGPKEVWTAWLDEQTNNLREVSKREHLEDWVTEDPLLDPPDDLGHCAAATNEAAAVECYFRHKRVTFQHDFFKGRAVKHRKHQHRFHKIPTYCFWTSIVAALLHFAFELSAGRLGEGEAHRTFELIARWLIVLAAAAPAVGAGFRTWLLAFEFGRSALLYRAQESCLSKRLEALKNNSPDGIFTAIWFTEQSLEEEHRAWIRLMLDAEWFG